MVEKNMKMTRGAPAMHQPLIRFLILSLALGAFLVPRSAGAQEEVRLQGSDVAVYNLAGHVEVVSGGGSDVVVQIIRGGGDADQLSIETIQANGREALVVHYPGDRIVYSELGRNSKTQLRVRSDGTFGDGGRSRGDEVEIRGSGRGLEAWADLRITVPAGKDLAVYLAVGEAEARELEADLLIDTGSGKIQAFGITGNVNLDTGSGAVVAEEIRGNLMVDTGSGSIRVAGVQGDEVTVDTGSGSVVADGITASRVEVDTGSGGIELSRVSSPDVYLDTGSGRIEVELLQDIDRMVIDTGSGSVVIRMPAGLGAEVEVDTGSGGIDIDVPLEVQQVRRNYLRGILGDGRGSIEVDTGSGSVRLIGG
jgi:lia operon protein LiaG